MTSPVVPRQRKISLSTTADITVIFIAGIDLSGSTVVDLALGSLPGVIGLGEVDNILSPDKRFRGENKNGPVEENICTCGQPGYLCPVWKPVLDFIEHHPSSSYSERYLHLIKKVIEVEPTTRFVVDSSKEAQAFNRVKAVLSSWKDGVGARYLLLILRRAPLSWLVSDRKRALRRGRARTLRILKRRLRKWIARYESLLRLARQQEGPVLNYSLHSFQQNPDGLKVLLNELLPGSFDPAESLELAKTKSHVLWGSHHRHENESKASVRKQPRESIIRHFSEALTVLVSPRAQIVNRRLKARERA